MRDRIRILYHLNEIADLIGACGVETVQASDPIVTTLWHALQEQP